MILIENENLSENGKIGNLMNIKAKGNFQKVLIVIYTYIVSNDSIFNVLHITWMSEAYVYLIILRNR